jgi:hypothetical protein
MPGRRRAASLCVALLTAIASAVAGGPVEARPVPPTVADAVTVHIDPSYQGPAFEGWGTSLVWFANITGGCRRGFRPRGRRGSRQPEQ